VLLAVVRFACRVFFFFFNLLFLFVFGSQLCLRIWSLIASSERFLLFCVFLSSCSRFPTIIKKVGGFAADVFLYIVELRHEWWQ